MLEDERKLTNKINPESLDPNHVSRPTVEEPEEKSTDYEDTPEFRKSLNMKVSQRVTPSVHPLSCQRMDIGCTEGHLSKIPFFLRFVWTAHVCGI